MWDFRLFPEQASTLASKIDGLYWFILAISAFFTLAIYLAIAILAIRYRRGTKVNRLNPPGVNRTIEAIWIGVPLAIVMVIFVWSTNVFFNTYRVPPDASTIYVVGKQWMWKFQNPEGPSEINELHVPTGRKIRLKMISQDVIHSLYIPAFRTKKDVLPGRYTEQWFEATKPGTYHLFCAEYCGTEHSGMVGQVVVMKPEDYEAWLRGVKGGATPASTGEQLFTANGCSTCHVAGGGGRAPSLVGVYGHEVVLQTGEKIVADDDYIRESILNPRAKVVRGYPTIMPTFSGQLSEEQIIQLITYVKSLGGSNSTQGTK